MVCEKTFSQNLHNKTACDDDYEIKVIQYFREQTLNINII